MNESSFSGARVAVFGLGYVGCVTAACLARLGHSVLGVDRDEFKVRTVNEGRAPFYEPGLADVVRQAANEGRLRATADAAEAVAECDYALLCVGTPSARNGNLSTEQLERVSAEIGGHLRGREKPFVVAVRSTVFPGTCEEVVRKGLGDAPAARVVANPEFLREGNALKDFLEPSLIVVGGDDPEAVRSVADLYGPLGVAPCLVSLRTAEMIKYACNAFHALKVTFANEVGALSDQMGIDGHEVMDTLCRDNLLNISRAYLKPGFAFGGSCLPKDLRALTYRANRLDMELPLLASVLPSNQKHLQRAIEAVLDLPADRIGIFGLAFKENTDDLRESPVVALVEQLIGKGKNLKIYDPHIQLDRIYGSNEQFLMQSIPHIGRLLTGLDDLLEWSEHIVVAQKPGPEHWDVIGRSGRPLLDLVRAGAIRQAAQS
jgi:GDP-mannose 6-dehydrogenase